MAFGIGLFIILIVVSGFIAYVGDNVGRKVGKKRISIFGLRPKYTSIIITIITGIMIVSVTLAVVLALSSHARTSFFGMQKLLKSIAATENELEKTRRDLARRQTEFDDILGAINLKTMELSQLKESRKKLAGQVENLDAERDELEKKKKKLEDEIRNLTKKSAEILGETKRDVLFGRILYKKDEPLARFKAPKGTSDAALTEGLTRRVNTIFKQAVERGAVVESEADAIFTTQLRSLKETLEKSGGDLLIEIRSHTNVLAGQPIYLSLTAIEDRQVYRKGNVIEKDVAQPGMTQSEASEILSDMLTRASEAGRRAGLLPDPEHGRVGTVPARRFEQSVSELTKIQKPVTVELIAAEDVYISGRLNADFRIR